MLTRNYGISNEKTSVSIVNEQGEILHESEVNTNPNTPGDAIEKTSLKIEHVGFESGSLGHYLTQGFRERGIPAVCIDAQRMSAILSIRVNKIYFLKRRPRKDEWNLAVI